MRRTNNARRGLGIRGQLMFFLCFICLFLLVLFWILSTQLLEPLYTRHIERQLTTQAENVVSQLDDALAAFDDRRMALALDQGMQLLAHCNGDAAAGQYLSVLEQLEREREAHLERPVMIHAQLLDLDQMDKVKELGVVPSFFAAHVYHWGDVHVKNFGAERAARISPAGAALERDIPFTFHQDTPVLPPDMLETVWCGVNRLTRSGAVLGPEQKIPVVEALAAVTIRAAWQYFEEGEKGSLREGKRADLVLLERDPLTADPMSLRDIPVLATWKDGRLIYRREG